jgi:peptidylprolyl isomerase
MKKHALAFAVSILSVVLMRAAPAQPVSVPKSFPAPSEIVAAAPVSDWVAIAPSDLLLMDLAPDSKGKPRRVVIQLIPAPFSQGWIGNIRKLAAAHWWDGTAIVRVQDNYVTQWGDPDGEVAGKAKPLPDGLASLDERNYMVAPYHDGESTVLRIRGPKDIYADWVTIRKGWPVGGNKQGWFWPTHCYGMVGVGRNLSPDTGTGAELYTVIGHAPRHLDRNIALVGRIIEGMENMSSLPRGTGDLGFYKTPEERTTILSVRLMSEMGNDKPLPTYEYLNTDSKSFAKYADARANRRDPFFIKSAGGADICNIPVPVRRVKR